LPAWPPLSRSCRSLLLALSLLAAPFLVAPRRSEAQAQARKPAPVIVELEPGDGGPDEAAVRGAIGEELGAPAVAPDDPAARGARGELRLRVDVARRELVMRYRPRGGVEFRRKVTLPEERSAQLTTIALLAGNMARDEAAELLAGMRPAPAVPSGEPATSASAAGSAPVPGAASSAAPGAASSAAPGAASSAAPGAASSAAPGAASAPPPAAAPPAGERPRPACARRMERSVPIRISLVDPVASFPAGNGVAAQLQLSLLYGRVGEVRAGHVAGLVDVVDGDAGSVGVAGVGSLVAGEVEGALLAGVFSFGGCDARGAVGAGVVSAVSGRMTGVQFGGVVSSARGGLDGAQVAGVVNVAGSDVEGAQIAGVVNVAEGRVRGAQVAGVGNYASGAIGVAQVALVNVGGDVEGGQVGLVNAGGHVEGFQVGLVNVARRMDGLAIGLVSVADNTVIQAVAWASGGPQANLGLKFTTNHVYTMFSGAYARSDGVTQLGGGFTAGLHFPFGITFFDADLGFHYLAGLSRRGGADGAQSGPEDRLRDGTDEAQIRLRALVGLQPFAYLGVFAGLGAAMRGPITDGGGPSVSPDFSPDFSLGVQFLRRRAGALNRRRLCGH
jgi:hypothetical protein